MAMPLYPQTNPVQTVTSVGNASTLLVLRNEQRQSVVITAPVASVLNLSFGVAAVVGNGIRIPAGQGPVVLSRDLHGRLVDGPIYAIMTAGTETIGVWESVFT